MIAINSVAAAAAVHVLYSIYQDVKADHKASPRMLREFQERLRIMATKWTASDIRTILDTWQDKDAFDEVIGDYIDDIDDVSDDRIMDLVKEIAARIARGIYKTPQLFLDVNISVAEAKKNEEIIRKIAKEHAQAVMSDLLVEVEDIDYVSKSAFDAKSESESESESDNDDNDDDDNNDDDDDNDDGNEGDLVNEQGNDGKEYEKESDDQHDDTVEDDNVNYNHVDENCDDGKYVQDHLSESLSLKFGIDEIDKKDAVTEIEAHQTEVDETQIDEDVLVSGGPEKCEKDIDIERHNIDVEIPISYSGDEAETTKQRDSHEIEMKCVEELSGKDAFHSSSSSSASEEDDDDISINNEDDPKKLEAEIMAELSNIMIDEENDEDKYKVCDEESPDNGVDMSSVNDLDINDHEEGEVQEKEDRVQEKNDSKNSDEDVKVVEIRSSPKRLGNNSKANNTNTTNKTNTTSNTNNTNIINSTDESTMIKFESKELKQKHKDQVKQIKVQNDDSLKKVIIDPGATKSEKMFDDYMSKIKAAAASRRRRRDIFA